MKKILLSTLVASLLITGSYAKESAPKNATVKQVKTIAVNNAKEDMQNHTVKVVQDAVDSLAYAHDAYAALEKGHTKEATTKLEKALGKLEVTLASKDAPKMLPVESSVVIHEFIGSSEDIKKVVTLAKALLNDDKVQDAKEVLAPLKSEIVLNVVSLPLATYPVALKETAKLIHDNKVEEAKVVLATALNTLVGVETVVPIPLVNATDLIAASAAIVEEDPEAAKAHLDAAQEELKIAKYLGYLSKSDVTYKALDDAISSLKIDIKSKEVKALFTNLENKVKDFTSKIFSSKDEPKK